MYLPQDRSYQPHPYDTHVRLPTVQQRVAPRPQTLLSAPSGDQRLSNYLSTFAPAPKSTRAQLFGTVDAPAMRPPPALRYDAATSRLFSKEKWSFDLEAAAAHSASVTASRTRAPHLPLPAYTHELPRPDLSLRLSSPRLSGARRRKGSSPTRPHTSSPRCSGWRHSPSRVTVRPKPLAARPGTSDHASSAQFAAMRPKLPPARPETGGHATAPRKAGASLPSRRAAGETIRYPAWRQDDTPPVHPPPVERPSTSPESKGVRRSSALRPPNTSAGTSAGTAAERLGTRAGARSRPRSRQATCSPLSEADEDSIGELRARLAAGKLLSAPETRRLREAAEAEEADEDSIGELRARLAAGQLPSAPEMQRLREAAAAAADTDPQLDESAVLVALQLGSPASSGRSAGS